MFAKFFIDRPIFAWVIALVILLAGGLALRGLPLSQYPAVAPPSIAFNIVYPGASAKVVEDTVTALIEQEMNGIEHLLYMEASSELGTGTVTLTFEPGTNIDVASVEAQNRFKRIEARLPDDVPAAEKRRRLNVLLALQEQIGLERNRAWLGREVEVLVETIVPRRAHDHDPAEGDGPDDRDRPDDGAAEPDSGDPDRPSAAPAGEGRVGLSGRTRGNKLVHLLGDPALVGHLVSVRVEHAGPYSLRGRLVGAAGEHAP